MNRFAIVLAAIVCLSACSPKPSTTGESAADSMHVAAEALYEITENPKVAFDPDTPLEQLTLRGIRLNDDESVLPARRIRSRQENGWIVAKGSCRYRVVDGKMVTLGLWDGTILSRLGVETEDDIARVIGEPEKKLELTHNVITYHFRDGSVRLIWHRFENRLVAMNIGRPAMEPEDLSGESK